MNTPCVLLVKFTTSVPLLTAMAFISTSSSNFKLYFLHFLSLLPKLDPESGASKIYWNVEKTCRKYVKIVLTWVVLNHTMTFASLLNSIYFIAIGNYDSSNWILPFDLVVPFGTEHILGWYLLWTFNLMIDFAYCVCVSSPISHFLCYCLYIRGICDHFDSSMESVQRDTKSSRTEKNPLKYREVAKRIKEELCKAIEVQVKLFE